MYIQYSIQLLLLRLYFNNAGKRMDGIKYLSVMLFVFPLLSFAGRLSGNIIFCVWKVRSQQYRQSSEYDKYVTVFTYDLLKEDIQKARYRSPEEEDLILRIKSCTNIDKKSNELFKVQNEEPLDPTFQLLQTLQQQKMVDQSSMFIILQLKAVYIRDSLMSINRTLLLLNKKLGR